MKTVGIVAMGLAMTLCLALGASWAGTLAEESCYQGVAQGVQGNLAAAREAFKEALSLDPFCGPAIFGLETLNDVRNKTIKTETAIHLFKAMALGNDARWEENLAQIDQALKLDPHYVPAFIHRGNAHQELGEYEWAISVYSQALQVNPRSAAAYFNRGVAYGRMGEWDRALNDYDQALKLKPRFVQAYYVRGNAHRKKGALDLALADYRRALEINPRFAEAYFNQAVVLEQTGRGGEAAAAFRSFIAHAHLEFKNKIQYAQQRIAALDGMHQGTPPQALRRDGLISGK
ncbi:MAG: tetratricopeptide repeat protein [Deltaproteobacteria bacterium]|nr:tetratricopeptide repeat protein [Deltaproteobacteria bacterium]